MSSKQSKGKGRESNARAGLSRGGEGSTNGASTSAAALEANGQPAKAALTPVQQVIRGVLHKTDIDLDVCQIESLHTLAMENRPLLPDTSARVCCFDVAATPSAWTCMMLCARCKALSHLIQLSSSESPRVPAFVAEVSLQRTACISDTKRTGTVPSLPIELIEGIIKHCVQDMIDSKDGSTVRCLMHTSSLFRLRVIKAFKPIRLFETLLPAYVRDGNHYPVPRELVTHVWDAVEYWLSDLTTKRHSLAAPSYSMYTDEIITANGTECKMLRASASFTPTVLPNRKRKRPFHEEESYTQSSNRAKERKGRNVRNACSLISYTLGRLGPTPRSASAFQRALDNTVEQTTGGTVEVILDLQDPEDDDIIIFRAPWRFTTWAPPPVDLG